MIAAILALLPTGNRGRIAAHFALTIVSVGLRAASAVLLVPLVAALFGPTPSEAWPWVGWLAAAVVCGWLVDWFVARIAFELGFALLDHGQRSLAEQVNRIRLTWFDAETTPVARQAIAAIGPELVGLIVYLATPFFAAILLPIAIGFALLPISVPLGIAALAGVPILLGAYALSARLSRAADRAAGEANSALTERVLEFGRTQQALRAARRVEPERSQVGAALDAQHGAMLRLLAMQVPGQLVFSLASQLALLLLAGTAVWLAVRGQLGAPEAVALIVVIARYLEPFTALAGLAAGMESTLEVLRRVRAVLAAPTVTSGEVQCAAQTAPRIELRDVSFSYCAEPGTGADRAAAAPVLDRLNLSFEPGTTTAIVGPSGSGKSTVLALIAGLQQPDSGSILFTGAEGEASVDAAKLDPDSRRALTTVVFQQPYLFDTSVRENVLVGDPAADDERFANATRLARVDSLVERLPHGWQSRAGEGGASLSGGERQRVSIARALLKPAPVLLVDEATSALDTENEAAVAAALGSDSLERTRVIVAHRLSSIRAADRVIFLDEGRVVEDGGYEDLLAAGGRFAEFYAQQHAAAGWRIGR